MARPLMKVLIVDDSPQMRQMVKFYLRGLADETCECEDGAEALDAYRKFQPDWVLMGWEMKRMDGLAATRRIRASFPEAHILFVTQYDEPELRQAAAEVGASGFVSKDDLLTLQSVGEERARYLKQL